MMSVASGDPPIRATGIVARVLTMLEVLFPASRRWAHSIVVPSPAGTPSTTRATVTNESVDTVANAPARRWSSRRRQA